MGPKRVTEQIELEKVIQTKTEMLSSKVHDDALDCTEL